MKPNIKNWISALLILSAGLLAILIPGGPVETRNFSHIDPLVLGTFNTFLTSLAMVSLSLVYFVLKNRKWAFIASAICGLSYFLVYALDLGTIFPVSPDAMPQRLFIIEVLGAIVSLPLTVLSLPEFVKSGKRGHETVKEGNFDVRRIAYFTFFLIFASVGIITFATQSAMGN